MTLTATATGRVLDLRTPDPQAICIADIAQGLAQRNLFAGAACRPISYAEHSLLMSEALSRDYGANVLGQMAALLNFGCRAYTEGLHGPMAQLVGLHLFDVERRVQAAVLKRFGLMLASGTHREEITLAHRAVSAAEVRDLLPQCPQAWPELVGVRPVPWLTLDRRELFTWRDWAQMFEERHAALQFGLQEALLAVEEDRL